MAHGFSSRVPICCKRARSIASPDRFGRERAFDVRAGDCAIEKSPMRGFAARGRPLRCDVHALAGLASVSDHDFGAECRKAL